MQNENIQTSVLFDDSISCLHTSSNGSNIVHKNSVTSISNNSQKALNNKNLYVWSIRQSHNNALSLM